jgi:hypothetical protein
MSDNTQGVLTLLIALGLVGFVAHTVRSCEGDTPRAIEACVKSCGPDRVHSATRMKCECK